MDRDTIETKQSKGVLQLSNSSSLNSMKNDNASEHLVDDNFGKDGETQSEKSDESTENLSFLNESDLIDDILMPENIVSDDEMSNPENCVYAYRGSVSESPDLLLRNQQNNQQDDETDFLEMDFDPEQNSDADGGCYLDFQHLLADNKTAGKSLENGKNSAKLDDMNLNCSIAPPNISAISITVAPSTSQYAAKEILDATKPSTNKNTGTIPKKPLKSPNCSFIPTMSSHLYQTKSKLKDTYLINNNINNINNNHLNSVNVSFVNKKLSNSSHINNNTINSNLNNNIITNLKNTNNNNNSNHITNNNITSYDPSLLVTPNQISVSATKSSSPHIEKAIYSGMFKKSDSDKNIQTTQNICKSDEVYSNGDVLFLDKLLYVDDKKNSVNIFNQNCDEKTIIDALESIGLEPNKSIIKKYFIEMDTSEMDLPDYLLYLSKRNCDYHKLRDIILLSCSCDKLSITFHPLHQLDIVVTAIEQQQTHTVTVPIKEILKRWTASTNLKQIIKIKNKNYHTMNVLGKIINVLRQPRQRLILENFIEIPHFYVNGYLNVSKLSTSSSL